MISRQLLLLDRLATLVIALLLVAGGALGVWWWTGSSPLADTTNTSVVRHQVDMSYFPWATAVVGLLLVYLGLRWLFSHLSRSNVTDLRLRGSNDAGTLVVDAGKVTDAAADALADTLGVRSARGTMTRDRGQLVARLTATIEPAADLAGIARQADLVSAQLAQVVGRDDLRCRVELKVARRGRQTARVS